MDGKWRGEEVEDDNECLRNRAYIGLSGILILQHRILKIEIDGRLPSVEGEIDYVFGWRKTFRVKKTLLVHSFISNSVSRVVYFKRKIADQNIQLYL